MIAEVSNALIAKPGIKKALILKHIPRYDDRQTDPHLLKAALATLYNETLTNKWLDSPLKDRLEIGSHMLECHGAVFEARYKNAKKNLFDGVHMLGCSGKKLTQRVY